ncbi:extensin family protein [Allorhizobium sp. BGMRC 0089]|uniref:extensin-like domain-containing protein n=1 Tax=Allorhizobium sonneratiae TaxID=2934936 RepID=UPI00203362D1|nr:extensin family protein [Allorhizobium sonneratiae]MCM2291164.1 extensin family protein [Allorhizobium sonneratiae]
MRHSWPIPFLMLILLGATLPEKGPLPREKPASETEEPAQDAPLPQAKPEAPQTSDAHGQDQPQPAPEKTDHPKATEQTPAEPEPAIATEDPAEYAQCLSGLKQQGVVFEELPRIDDGHGCGIDRPVKVTAILPGVALKPAATFRCEAALELSQWLKTMVIPATKEAMPDKGRLIGVEQASSYVCRNRNSAATGKMSEHARGNAIDIAALEFEKGKVDMVIAPEKATSMEAAFQRTLNASACLYFTTVLSPGSDPTHQTHMHLDLIKRRHDGRFCRFPVEEPAQPDQNSPSTNPSESR